MTPAPPALTLFISYSHKDEALKDELVVHLASLKRQGKIQAWQDRDIEAGTEWDAEIKQQLEAAEIILLLITPRFIASDYCYDEEMQQAMQRHEAGSARVIPVILKPCDWQHSPFSKLQVVPKDAKPVAEWSDPDAAFLNIAQNIRRTVESLQAKKPLGETPNSQTVSPSTHSTGLAPHSTGLALPNPSTPFSTYNPATFTGREAETETLSNLLKGCRILTIVGMTGIGKTALAERVVAHLMQTPEAATLPYYRFSLDDRSLTPDFSNSGAALLRTLGEEPTLADQQDPANLLAHILNRLHHPCRLQIDSLERLLRGNEQEGWSEFCDPLWLDLLQQFLSATDSPSQLLLTSQDIPADLDAVASRYPQFWHCEALQGLSADEQQTLFQKLGLPQDADSLDYLSRIGEFYSGHPLVLQVIADEIRQLPFQGNVARYWHHYAAEFTATPATPTHKLSRSRLFRRRVRQRVEQSLHRLATPARQMLCASTVFRRPVPVEFWYAMLTDDPEAAFDTLQDRHLVEFAPPLDDSAPLLVRQHNLIRSVAYDLLKADPPTWEAAERQAAHLWLTAYKPAPHAPNLETVRGYLEAFDHYCEVGDWEVAVEIAWTRMNTPTQEYLCWQLGTWGYVREQVLLYSQLLDIARKTNNRQGEGAALGNLGVAYYNLGQYERAIDLYQQHLTMAREIGDRQGEGNALGNLGNAYDSLGQYERAIDLYQQHLTMAREIGDRQSEGNALGNLGNAYKNLGQYERAIDFHQQCLTIAREIGDRQGEGNALGNLGNAYKNLGQYERAIDFHQQRLTIAREIGDRQGEGNALGNLGNVYDSLGQYERAIDCHQQCLTIVWEIGDRQGEAIALGNLGGAYCALGDYSRALDLQNQKLAIASEIRSRGRESNALSGLGEVLIKLKRFAEALEALQSALEICQETGERSLKAEALKNLAELHQALGEVEMARQFCQQALALATELGIPLKAECEALMAKLEQHISGEYRP
jgi:tetratricopeptide (TPR) repeat protein